MLSNKPTAIAVKYREFIDAVGWMNVVDFAVEWPFDSMPCVRVIHDQATAEERVPWVLERPLASPDDLRILWLELSGPVDLTPWLKCQQCDGTGTIVEEHDYCTEYLTCPCEGRRLNWVILSGSQTGPTDLEWLRKVIADCKAAGVPVLVRNIGSDPVSHGVNLREAMPEHLRQYFDPKPVDTWAKDLRVFEYPKCFEEA